MKKRSIAWILCISVLICMAPVSGISAEDAVDSSVPGAAEGQIVVLYEDGAVDTDKPVTAAEKRRARKAPRSDSFGSSMAESDGTAGAREAENTLGQQAEIIEESLKDNYVIEDTVVFDTADKGQDEMVVSVISSDEYSTDQMTKLLERNDKVKAAEPNYEFKASAMPDWNDRYLKESWQTGEKGVNADSVWEEQDINKADDPVVIAVMDTGIDYEHPELSGRMWTEPDGFKLKGFHGIDYVDGDGRPMDEHGHGTHCAGIIAAQVNNAEGITGIAGGSDKIQLMAVRILDEEGSGYLEDIVSAFHYLVRAKKAGANIKAVNCSFGASVTSEIFDEVIDKTGEAGILTIAAAGNEAANNDEVPSAPANCKSEYVVSVAALDDNGEAASYTNYGRAKVDIAAPGSNILSSVSYDNYMPFLYTADQIRENTQTYGEFGDAVIEETTDADGNTVQTVTPVLGTDYDGEEITGVDGFGSSVSLSRKVVESEGETSLELTDEDGFPIGNNNTSLRWNIKGASSGDVYVLYFPYEKMATGMYDTYVNMAFRTHTEKDGGGSGMLEIGDVISYTDKNGDMSYRTVVTDEMFDSVAEVSYDWNSIWNSSGMLGALYPRSEIRNVKSNIAAARAKANKERAGALDASGGSGEETEGDGNETTAQGEGYGLGFVYTAYDDGDISVDISSLAVSRIGADESTFGRYDVYSGTSMATPVVTGSVGLIAAMEPDADALTLRDRLYQTTRGGYDDICSTGGAVDFSEYRADQESGKPVAGDATVDHKNKTVTITGRSFGSEPSVTAVFNFAGKTEEISPSDISVKDGELVIKDNYGLLGSDVTFKIRNSETGLEGSRTFYLVKGLSSYTKQFSVLKEADDDFFFWSKDAQVRSDDDDLTDPEPFLSGLKYLKGADRYLLFDNDLLYSLKIDKKNNRTTLSEVGNTVAEAISEYAARMAKKSDMWKPDSEEQLDGEEGYYTTEVIADPVYMGNQVYRLLRVDMVDREAILLLRLDINKASNKWEVCYDSLADFGSAPAELKWQELTDVTLAGYKNKIYLLGVSFTDRDGNETLSTDTYCCTPSNKGSKWVKSADLPAGCANGKAIGQGGNLYYFLGYDSEQEIIYDIYKFNGSSWSVAGTLPPALFKDGTGDVDIWSLLAGILPEGEFPCAYGIDSQGLIFAGTSFDGGGDTFRFNTGSGKIEPLGYTLWSDITDRAVDGTVAGGSLIAQYDIDDGVKTEAKSIPVTTGYAKVKTTITGKGKGTVVGNGSHPKGEASDVVITPASGSYVYEIHSKGLTKNFNKKYGAPTKASKGTFKTSFSAKADATLTIHFGKISTKITVKKVKKVKVGKRRLKAYTNGTVSGVKWKSSNKKYAKVNKNGTITFTKKGAGKTVKLTAISKDNPKLKKTIKVKIVKKK